MQITITVPEHLQFAVLSLLAGAATTATEAATAPAAPAAPAAESKAPKGKPKKEPPAPTPAPNQAAPAAAATPAATPAVTPTHKDVAAEKATTPGNPSLDETRAALVAADKRAGTDAAWGVMLKWKVSRVSDIPEDRRAAFIAELGAL